MDEKPKKVIKPITLKAYEDDKTYLDKLAATSQCTIADAFAIVIEQSRTATENARNQVNLLHENEQNKEKLADLQGENEILNSKIEFQKANIQELLAQIEILKNQAPEVKEVTKEVIKEVTKELTGHQFICELSEETALFARKVRKFAKDDGHVQTTAENYPNELANTAIKYFLERKYEDFKPKN